MRKPVGEEKEHVGDTVTGHTERYRLGFTSGSLMTLEGVAAAGTYNETHNWEDVRSRLTAVNALQARTAASSARRIREVIQRLAELTDAELETVASGTSTEVNHLMWVAACRRYTLIGEFAEEVLRERFLTLSETVTHDDFDTFLLAKTIWHDEIAELKTSTTRKLRANMFRMLVEAGLLGDDGRIIPALLSERVTNLMDARTPSDLRFFPVRQAARGSKI